MDWSFEAVRSRIVVNGVLCSSIRGTDGGIGFGLVIANYQQKGYLLSSKEGGSTFMK